MIEVVKVNDRSYLPVLMKIFSQVQGPTVPDQVVKENLVRDVIRPLLMLEQTNGSFFYEPTKRHFDMTADQEQEFWRLYCKEVHEGRRHGIKEVRQGCVQLSFDLYFEFPGNTWTKITSDNLLSNIDGCVTDIIQVIQNGLDEYFELSNEMCELIAVYLKFELSWRLDKIFLEGRIVFPYARIADGQLEDFMLTIRPKLPVDMQGAINLTPALCYLYGSGDAGHMDGPWHELTAHALYGNLRGDMVVVVPFSVLGPNLHKVTTDNQVLLEAELKDEKYWLPMCLSHGFYNKPIECRKDVPFQTQVKQAEEKPVTIRMMNNTLVLKSEEELENALKIQEDITVAQAFIACYNDFFRVVNKNAIYIYENGVLLWKPYSMGEFSVRAAYGMIIMIQQLQTHYSQLAKTRDTETKNKAQQKLTACG